MIFDTDFLIACAKGTRALPKPHAKAFLESLPGPEPLLISKVTWMEFVAGYDSLAPAEADLERFTVLDFDGDLWWGASRIMRDLGRKGLRIGTPDCMIAATALAYGQSLVTLNRSHFARVAGLNVVVPS